MQVEAAFRSLWQVLATAGVLGLSAGVSPGPLLALVVGQTLRWGFREGAKVAATPVLTDFPIVVGALLVVRQTAGRPAWLGILAGFGAGYLAYLAWETWRGGSLAAAEGERPRSWTKGILANLLNPHPYLFWTTVAAPLVLQADAFSRGAAAGFLAVFYGTLVGSKMVVAWLVGRAGGRLSGAGYRWVLRGIALLLLAPAIRLALWAAELLG
ncbi:MAG: LysE family translocator [Acidobacteriota bacterium]